MAFKLGIDVGGTFTYLFLWSSDGRIETHKTLSTPADPSIGLVDGLRALADRFGMEHGAFARAITSIVHGTTVTTNATLTRKGAVTGLLTTEGVRDALEMRRGIREAQYDNRYQNVLPLVPRALRLPVRGRLDRDGKELIKFGKSGKVKASDFGGCCEPKNLRVLPNGDILAAESGPPTCIKRFSADGKFIEVLAMTKEDGDCVRVTVEVSPDGKQFYMLDTKHDAIRIFAAKS